jgi:hypothetical protein
VLAGTIYPHLEGPELVLRDFALLVIWAVVGGFSETLVPDLLERTASRAREENPENDNERSRRPRRRRSGSEVSARIGSLRDFAKSLGEQIESGAQVSDTRGS